MILLIILYNKILLIYNNKTKLTYYYITMFNSILYNLSLDIIIITTTLFSSIFFYKIFYMKTKIPGRILLIIK